MDKGLLLPPEFTSVVNPGKKPDAVLEQVREVVRRAAPGSRLPNVGTFCREMRISPNTLDKVFTALEKEGLVDRRKGSGIFVRETAPRQAARVALVGDSSLFQGGNRSPVWDILLRRSSERAQAGGEVIEFHFTAPGEVPLHRNLLEDIQRHRVHGLITVGLKEQAAFWIDKNLASSVPVVSIFNPGRWMVGYDDVNFVRMGVEALFKTGAQRLGFWRGVSPHRLILHEEGTYFSRARRTFAASLAEHNLEFDLSLYRNNRHLIAEPQGETEVTMFEQGYATAMGVFSAPRETWPEGVLIDDDTFARGALIAMQKLGVVPGREVQIVAHSNRGSDVLVGHDLGLTFLEYDPEEVVETLFDTLETLMRGDTPPSIPADASTPEYRLRMIQPRISNGPANFFAQ